MIRISKLADYAVVILAAIADDKETCVSAATVSARSGLPEPTVAKVLKLLSKGGVLESVRGAGGGYTLAGTAQSITVADIVMAVDGPIALTACVENSTDSCEYACSCPVKGRWDGVNLAIRTALSQVSLADMLIKKAPARIQNKEEEGINERHI